MAFIFKIKLEGSSKPPIWRSLKMDASHSFLDLHFTIQGVFNWENTHLFKFSPTGWGSTPQIQENFEGEADWDEASFVDDPDTWPYGERYDATKIKLTDFFHILKQKMIYTYDFGDDWRHSITLTEITDENLLAPQCLNGKGTAPVEDCGGIWGYYNMAEAINDPKHPEHKDFRVWLGLKKGQHWELNAFDLEESRKQLQEVWREGKGN